MTSPDRRARALAAAAFATAVTCSVYALVRAFERGVLPEPNPAALIWSERSAFAWRAIIALYAGGAAFFGGYALTAKPRLAGRAVLVATVIAISFVTLQVVFAP